MGDYEGLQGRVQTVNVKSICAISILRDLLYFVS